MKKKLVALGMAFLMAMSTCMTAFAGYWYIEDGRWEYRDDSGARVRNMTNVLTAFSCQRTFVIFLFAK